MTELNGFKIEKYNQYNLDLNQRYSTCPLCSHTRRKNPKQKCLTIFADTGLAHCSHCGERVQLHTYKKKEQDVKYEKPKTVNNTDLPDSLVKYWHERGISQFTLRMMKVGYKREWMPGPNKELPAMFFPYYKNEELINIKYRAHYKEGEEKKRAFKLVKDAQKIPYNLDGIRTEKECIILEGEPDCLSFIECGIRNVTSSPNGSTNKGSVNLLWLDENIEFFENKDTIYLGLDNDEAGQHVQKELIRRLGAEKIKIIDYGEFKDGNEVLVKKGKEAVKKLIEDAQMIPLEGVSTYSDVKSELEEFYRNGWKKGYTCGIRDLDEKFSVYTGQYIVVTAVSRSGKSEVVDQMCLGYALKYGWHIGFASPENKPNFLHINKLLTKLVGYRPSSKNLQEDGYKKCSEYIDQKISLIDSDVYDLKTVLSKAAELVKRKGLKCLVIDPYNKVELKEGDNNNVNKHTTAYLNEIDRFCRKHDILIILVAHPVKMRKKENGEFEDPTMYDIKGGGEFFDMPYHGLGIYRDWANKVTKIKILKCKFEHLGENNAEVFVRWNPHNTRYMDLEGDMTTPLHERRGIADVSNWVTKNIESENEEVAYEEVMSGFSDDPLSTTEIKGDLPF